MNLKSSCNLNGIHVEDSQNPFRSHIKNPHRIHQTTSHILNPSSHTHTHTHTHIHAHTLLSPPRERVSHPELHCLSSDRAHMTDLFCTGRAGVPHCLGLEGTMTFRGLTRADHLLGLGPADLVPWEEENHLHKNPRASREGTPTAA